MTSEMVFELITFSLSNLVITELIYMVFIWLINCCIPSKIIKNLSSFEPRLLNPNVTVIEKQKKNKI